jgi:hypothetical protein
VHGKTTTRISPVVALGAEGKVAVEADDNRAQAEDVAKPASASQTELLACSAPPAHIHTATNEHHSTIYIR